MSENLQTAWSTWRFAHQAHIFLSVTLPSVAPDTREESQGDGFHASQLDPAFREAAFESLDMVGLSNGHTTYCADALRCFWHGA